MDFFSAWKIKRVFKQTIASVDIVRTLIFVVVVVVALVRLELFLVFKVLAQPVCLAELDAFEFIAVL